MQDYAQINTTTMIRMICRTSYGCRANCNNCCSCRHQGSHWPVSELYPVDLSKNNDILHYLLRAYEYSYGDRKKRHVARNRVRAIEVHMQLAKIVLLRAYEYSYGDRKKRHVTRNRVRAIEVHMQLAKIVFDEILDPQLTTRPCFFRSMRSAVYIKLCYGNIST